MARRRKGNPINGWLIVDKPAGVTSTAVVGKVRWACRAQKAGHAGTLDPLATGVLAVAIGEATKTVPYIQDALKTYRFTVRLGARTTTDDAEGEITDTSEHRPTDSEVSAALSAFLGDIMQVPPQFSAVKVAGERAYDLAREGEVLDLQARPLYVDRIELVARPDSDHAEIEMVCGKGGYVRSIARDLGEALGCHAHVRALRRMASAGFQVEDAFPYDDLDTLRERNPVPYLLPLEAGLSELPEVCVREPEAARLRNGNAAPIAQTDLEQGEEAWASLDGAPLAIVTYRAGVLHPVRVFVAARHSQG